MQCGVSYLAPQFGGETDVAARRRECTPQARSVDGTPRIGVDVRGNDAVEHRRRTVPATASVRHDSNLR